MHSSTSAISLVVLASTALAGVIPRGFEGGSDGASSYGLESLPLFGSSFSIPASSSLSKFDLSTLSSAQLAQLLAALKVQAAQHDSVEFNTKDFDETKAKDDLSVHKSDQAQAEKNKDKQALSEVEKEHNGGRNSFWRRGEDVVGYGGGLDGGLGGGLDLGGYEGGLGAGYGGGLGSIGGYPIGNYGGGLGLGFFDNSGKFHKLEQSVDRSNAAAAKDSTFDLDHDQALDKKKYNEVNYAKDSDKMIDLTAQLQKLLKDQQAQKEVDQKDKQEEGGSGIF